MLYNQDLGKTCQNPNGLEMGEFVTDQKTLGSETAIQRAGPSIPGGPMTEGRLLIQPHRAASFDGSGHFHDE